ncbi:MAG: AraC family transcriptional regulator [Bacteroidales bacterium]|nr:AraC family transcriptional regulator [Bacteroidales bacterium]
MNPDVLQDVPQSLKQNLDAKITALALDTGFSSSATFYRNFTAVTGLSPAAWLKEQQ